MRRILTAGFAALGLLASIAVTIPAYASTTGSRSSTTGSRSSTTGSRPSPSGAPATVVQNMPAGYPSSASFSGAAAATLGSQFQAASRPSLQGAEPPEAAGLVHASQAVGGADTMPVGVAPSAGSKGFWVATAGGQVIPEGAAPNLGDLSGVDLQRPIVGIASTPDGKGFWLVASDGGVFSFGAARFYGSTGGVALRQPVVGMAPSPNGLGYWLVASDGGVFSFGAARFYGSTGGVPLRQPVVGMASTADGKGYSMVASDGGIFTFGDARFYGSTGGVPLRQPIVGMTTDPSTGGYWLVAADGGVFTFNAPFLGGAGGQALPAPAIGLVDSSQGAGYWVVLGTGQVEAFGAAPGLQTVAAVNTAPCQVNPPGRKLLYVSIGDQELWACNGGELVSLSPVTTAAYNGTPTGTWQIYSKTTNVYLTGCDSRGCWDDFVHYWMPFWGPYGLHDAPWQTFPFGSSLYTTQGSHGCIHLPEAEATWVFDWAPVGTTVTVVY